MCVEPASLALCGACSLPTTTPPRRSRRGSGGWQKHSQYHDHDLGQDDEHYPFSFHRFHVAGIVIASAMIIISSIIVSIITNVITTTILTTSFKQSTGAATLTAGTPTTSPSTSRERLRQTYQQSNNEAKPTATAATNNQKHQSNNSTCVNHGWCITVNHRYPKQ